jgi:pimeloyl-ACP methyl ester carboxylesterase
VARRSVAIAAATAFVITVSACVLSSQASTLAANGLLHPQRHLVKQAAPRSCETTTFAGANVQLAGWWCRANGSPRGTVVYLHGVADNRASASGVIERLTARGFDVIAYDSRAHGGSDGDVCTYGYFEKHDLARVLDRIETKPIVLFGTSLGAAVAIQAAAIDRRVDAVIAAETFSDLRTVAVERAPRVLTRAMIEKAFAAAERQGHFDVDAVSPVRAAADVTVPVLLVHGARDVDTRPEHSERVFAALAGPKRLIIVPGAAHNGSLTAGAWPEIEEWLASIKPARAPR